VPIRSFTYKVPARSIVVLAELRQWGKDIAVPDRISPLVVAYFSMEIGLESGMPT
jgi:hypothetical protein